MAQFGIGMIGLGTVGTAVARRLIDQWELLRRRAGSTPVLRRVAVRDPGRPRDLDLPRVQLDGDAEALVDDPAVEVVVEAMGGIDRASALMDRALRAGKPVVTANKAALAAHGLELAALARENRVSLRYEAAVGAGLPVVALLRDSLRGDRVSGLEMIINGTTNVILTGMEKQGATLAEALADAQQRGFAEADPSADVDGHDAAAKLLLLSRLAFDAPLTMDDVVTVGIGGVTAQDIDCAALLGGSVKLVALAQREGETVTMSVRPTLVLDGHPLHGIDDSENALVVTSDLAGHVMVGGLGAGGDSTASAVVSDIVATVLAPSQAPPVPASSPAIGDDGAVERAGYVRVRLHPVADAAQLVIQALEDRGISVEASALTQPAMGADQELALRTGVVARDMLARAVETVDSLAVVDEVATVMDCVRPS
ncbi:MAG: homoserine dehydrogenase [Candidatus Dormibacteraeota bacterium]|uniref:Homoserine dehydrogenase n=1 Tax=Candidatus Aeolococcus gillhamiae TaxID=3127015 RepID=A0A2W6A546_9BACT|nr:homoserine dehydrogenase [Candidatus Dormibacteraeota bacterium]PZR78694.1 MAG: homoserine dehydrogenase [Candidatus Dormibacter sp. RRmetagenome_bin12]